MMNALLYCISDRGVYLNIDSITTFITLPGQIAMIRSVAQHAGLSQTCLERIAKAERVVPKMQATIEFVSGYVHKQVQQLDLPTPVAYVLHARLIPACYLERVAQRRPLHAGE